MAWHAFWVNNQANQKSQRIEGNWELVNLVSSVSYDRPQSTKQGTKLVQLVMIVPRD